MKVFYSYEDDTYYCREQIDNQTIELGMNCNYSSKGEDTTWWNIYISVHNKRKDMYDNMDKHIITGRNPFATFSKAREMFYELEAYVLQQELLFRPKCNKVVFFCTWVDNRRRDAYYRVLSKMGYDWGLTPILKHKCIMKVYTREDLNPEIEV